MMLVALFLLRFHKLIHLDITTILKSESNFSNFFLIFLLLLIVYLKLEGSATSDALSHAAEEQKEIAAKLESEKGD